jgi:ribonuclease P protein component
MSPERERIERRHRLTAAQDFVLVKGHGIVHRGAHALVIAHERPGDTRVAFVASRKGVGDAVQRNRARRRIREIVRRRWPRVAQKGWLLMFVAFRSAVTAPHQELASDLERILTTAGVLARLDSELLDASSGDARS